MNTLITLVESAAALLAILALVAIFVRKSSPATGLTLVWWLLVGCGAERCLAWLNFAFSALQTGLSGSGMLWGQLKLMVTTLPTAIAGIALFYLATRIAAVRARYTTTPPLRALSELRSTAATAEAREAIGVGIRTVEGKSRDAAASLLAQARAIESAGKTAWADSANTAGSERAKSAATRFWGLLSREQRMLLLGMGALCVVGIGVATETGKGGSVAGSGKGYVAELSCTQGSTSFPVYACMDGGSGIELRNGNHYKMYMQPDVMEMGQWTGSSIEIELADRFEINAQNRSDSVLLNVVIRNKASGAVVFQKSASQYGTIHVAN